jgi:hypothetical protein
MRADISEVLKLYSKLHTENKKVIPSPPDEQPKTGLVMTLHLFRTQEIEMTEMLKNYW